MLNDLFQKYDQLENFLKSGNKFSNQCIDLQRRAAMVGESEEEIEEFTKNLKKIQSLEKYLNF